VSEGLKVVEDKHKLVNISTLQTVGYL